MINALRVFFVVILLAMLSVTSWASIRCPLFAVPRDVATHPWFIATLFDAYFGFLTFYVWVAFKERRLISKIAWFVAVILLGNIATASYCLRVLWGASRESNISDLIVNKHDKTSYFGLGLAALATAVLFLA